MHNNMTPCPHCRRPIDFRRMPQRDREAALRALTVIKGSAPKAMMTIEEESDGSMVVRFAPRHMQK